MTDWPCEWILKCLGLCKCSHVRSMYDMFISRTIPKQTFHLSLIMTQTSKFYHRIIIIHMFVMALSNTMEINNSQTRVLV